MRKFIHSNFELDLSAYKITDTAENPWLTGNYFAKYSYPFTIELTDAIDAAMGFISHLNSLDAETIFEGIYVHGNTMEKAVLEVEELEKSLSLTLRYGLDDFPNFTKKLAELPLIKETVVDIYSHAAVKIQQTWPEANYNFPQIHTDKIETEDSEVWFAFRKIINDYDGISFPRNTVDLTEEIVYNRNIIQPLPYLLYLLKAGIEDAGYSLKGDILTDTDLMKTLVYTDTEYFTNETQKSIQVIYLSDDHDTYVVDSYTYPHITMNKVATITHLGEWRIVGTVYLQARDFGKQSGAAIYYRNTLLWSQSINTNKPRYKYQVDITFTTLTDLDPQELRFVCDMGYHENDLVFDLYVNPIRLHDDSGEPIASIINVNEVDLTRAVPDMTFGDLVKLVLAMKNMDITTIGTDVFINYVPGQINRSSAVDLSGYESRWPKRKFNTGNSYLFKYQDIQLEDYKYAEVFQNRDGVVSQGYTTDEKTTELTLNALPLPLLNRNEVQTAYAIDQDKSKPFFVLYDGLVYYNSKSLNLAKDPSPLFIPALHEKYYKEWWQNRLDSATVTLNFKAYFEELLQLTAKSTVYAYKNYMLVKSLQKAEVRPDLFEVEIEAEILK